MAHGRNSSSDTANVARSYSQNGNAKKTNDAEVTTTHVKTTGSNTKDLKFASLSSILRFSSISSIIIGHIGQKLSSFEMIVNLQNLWRIVVY